MAVEIAKKGYTLLIDGTTSEVLDALIAEGEPKIYGYTVDTATGKRYILASRR